jgi:hypothetical protein
MGAIDEALESLCQMENPMERALDLAGLISTVFKQHHVFLVVGGELAFRSYANGIMDEPELELAVFAGRVTPRLLQQVMRGELGAEGSIDRWHLAGIPVRFCMQARPALPLLCRDCTTDQGMVKLWPAEEITAQRILAAVFPEPNRLAEEEALMLLTNGLAEAFLMDWTALRMLCHEPAYRVGEELTLLRTRAKAEALAAGGEAPAGRVAAEQLPA